MDAKRAEQISKSTAMANVTYNGTPIYIEHVDESSEMCTIHPLDNPEQKHSVAAVDLMEQ